MQALQFDSISYRDSGGRVFLISGEIHYFRVAQDAWRDRLRKLKDAGGNCVATYVPWLVHEPEEGRFEFGGQFDVEAFLEVCEEVGLWAIVRPGPYQYSELVYDGLPGWLCEKYPELRARNLAGNEIRRSSVSYMHPLFLEKSRRWFEEVIPRLARHQTHLGGAVAAMQFDNELMGIHEWFGGWDYNRDTFGIGREQGRWPAFLKGKYGDVAKAAAAHESDAKTWSALTPPASASASTGARRAARDYELCYFEQIAEYAQTLGGWMREMGIAVPLVHNSAGPQMNAYFAEVRRALPRDFILGSDHYYNLGLEWPQNNPTPQWGTRCLYSLEMLRLWGYPPTVYELPGGSASDFPPLTPWDAACCYLTNAAFGMKGYNYYIFAGGENPPGMGTTSDIYDYNAAVSARGDVRPLYGIQQRFAAFLNDHAWLAESQIAGDVRVGFDYELGRAHKYAGDGKGLLFSPWQAWEFLRNGVLLSGLCGAASPTLADLGSDAFVQDTSTPLIVVSWDCMDEAIQRRLSQFVERGGKVLLLGAIPTMDRDFQPCTCLADYLGGWRQKRNECRVPRVNAFGSDNVLMNGDLISLEGYGASTVTARQVREPASVIGAEYRSPSGGCLSVLGFRWTHAMREHSAMLQGALRSLGHRPLVANDNPNVWAVVRSDSEHEMVFALNLLSSPMMASISYRRCGGQTLQLPRLTLPGVSVRVFTGGRWIDPCEALDLHD